MSKFKTKCKPWNYTWPFPVSVLLYIVKLYVVIFIDAFPVSVLQTTAARVQVLEYTSLYSILKLCWTPQLNSDSWCFRAQSVLNEGKCYGSSLEELPSLCWRWEIRNLIHWPYSPRDAGYINLVNVSPFGVGDTGKLDFLSAHFL